MKSILLKCSVFLVCLAFLSGCAGSKPQRIADRSAQTKAAASSYATKETPASGDKFLISDSEASWATKNVLLSSILSAVDSVELSATDPITFNSGTGAIAYKSSGLSAGQTWGWSGSAWQAYSISSSLSGLATTGITGDLTLTKTGTTARTVTFPDSAGTVALQGGNFEVGAATDTTLTRSAAGVLAVEGAVLATAAASQSGVHGTPSTTNPLAPTWTTSMHTIWYGATGEIDLPAASGYTGRGIIIYNTGAFTVTIDPNSSEVIVRDGTVQTGGVSMTLASGAGNYVALYCDGARWITLGFKGTLAAGT
jgi:hypothetical protein